MLLLDPTGRLGADGANIGALFTANDGGVYKLDLTGTPRTWSNLNNGLRISELLSVSYDPLNDLLLGGAQDNGVSRQLASAGNLLDDNGNALVDESIEMTSWQQALGGDGNTVVALPIDIDHNGKFDHTAYFLLGNNLDSFYVWSYDQNGNFADGSIPALSRTADAGVPIQSVNTTTGIFTTAAPHNLASGGPYLMRNNGGSGLAGNTDSSQLPAGAQDGVAYYVEVLSPTTFQLHEWSAGGTTLIPTTAGDGCPSGS